MKNLFKRELAIISFIKTISLNIFYLSSAALALIITVINLIFNNTSWVPCIGGIRDIALILIIIIVISFKKNIEKKELREFTFLQIILLLLYILIGSFFPNSVLFIKVFISLNVIFNLLIFVLVNLCELEINHTDEINEEPIVTEV